MSARGNTSSAVMAQRKEPPDSLDYFPTPPWATRALCERLAEREPRLDGLTAWEPACGEGHMSRPLAEYFGSVRASDIHDYGDEFPDGATVMDFTADGSLFDEGREPVDWVITNPPFNRAEAFLWSGLRGARRGVAMLLRTAWAESEGRFSSVFAARPPSLILQFSTRVIMARHRLRDPELPYFDADDGEDGKVKRPSSATAYCWFVWMHNCPGPSVIEWIGPERMKLTRKGDYPPLPPEERVGGELLEETRHGTGEQVQSEERAENV